jgi:hypothetical protein
MAENPNVDMPNVQMPEVGFNIRPLGELWFEESLPASLYQYFTGNTKKKQAADAKEILKVATPGSKEFEEANRIYNKFSYLLDEGGTFDASEVAKFLISHPSMLASELINATLADPYLLAIPIVGWGRLGNAAVKAVGATTVKAERLARAGAAVVGGAAFGTAYSIPLQLGEDADISAGRTIAEASIAGTANLAFGAMMGGLSSKLSAESGVTVEKTAVIIAQKMDKYPKDLDKALKEATDEVLSASKGGPVITEEIRKVINNQVAADKHKITNATIMNEFNWKSTGSLAGVGGLAGFLTAEEDKLATAATLGVTFASIPLVVKGIRKAFDTSTVDDKISKAKNQIEIKEIALSMQSNVIKVEQKVRQFNALKTMVDPVKAEAMVFAMQAPKEIAKDGTFTFQKFNKAVLLEANNRYIKRLPEVGQEKAALELSKYIDDNLEKITVKFTQQEFNLVKPGGVFAQFHDGMASVMTAKNSKVGYLRNYISQEWEATPGGKAFNNADKIDNQNIRLLDGTVVPAKQLFGGTGGLGKSAKQRIIPTYEQGIRMGYMPKTTDNGDLNVFDIMSRYATAIGKATNESNVIKHLKESNFPGMTTPIIHTQLDRIPKDIKYKFKEFDHPILNKRNYVSKLNPKTNRYEFTDEIYSIEKAFVHEDAIPYLRMVMDAQDPNALIRHSQNLNFFMKRFAVGASFFHAASLVESVFYTFGPLKGLKPAGRLTKEAFSNQKSLMLKAADDPNHPDFLKFLETEYKPTLDRVLESDYGDVVELLVRNGLTINKPTDIGADSFYKSFNNIEDAVSKLPAMGKVLNDLGVKPTRKVFRWFDKITWERSFTNMKLYTGLAKLNQLVMENPKTPLTILARDAGEFANDAFGGQDFTRLAMEVTDPMLRDMAMAAFKPSARPYLQLALFAPDWTISNLRVAGRAIPAFNANERNRNLYMTYLINGAILYGTLANAMNYAFTGHSILENKDPTRIDLGNGEVLTFSKQYMEPFHWLTDPQKTGVKKLGSLTKTFGEIMTNREYLTTGWSPSITKKDDNALDKALAIGGQVGQKFLPIWLSQAVDEYMEDGLSYDDALNVILGQLGHPKYNAPRSSAFKTRELIQNPTKALF